MKKVNPSEANKSVESKMIEIQRLLDQAGGSLASVEIAEASAMAGVSEMNENNE